MPDHHPAGRLWCRGRDQWGNRCHITGTEQPEEVRVIRKRYNAQGELEYRLRCDKCGNEWPSLSPACKDLPGAKDAPIEYAEITIPRVWK